VILVVDNYDSFTWNLVQHLGALGAEPRVVRNDEATVEEVRRMDPDRIVLSPGPCTPREAGISIEVVRVRAARLMHGKTAPVFHHGRGIFRGIPSPFTVARYHSLVTDGDALPGVLEPVAWSEDGGEGEAEIQGMRHREHPVWGVQFHPESLFSEAGPELLENFLEL